MLEKDSIRIGESQVSFLRSAGEGPPLLILPGGVVDHIDLTWKHVARLLAEHYTVLAPDLPGFGDSIGIPESGFSTPYVTSFIRDFIASTGMERPVLMANSMSGAPALEMGLRHADEIRALVLSGAYGWAPRVPGHALIHALAQRPRTDSLMRTLMRIPGVVRIGLRSLVKHGEVMDAELLRDAHRGADAPEAPTAFVDWLRDEIRKDSVRSDYRDELPQLALPTLILQGAYDWLAPERHAREAAALIPHSHYRVFETGHLPPREAPAEVAMVITTFLKDLERRSTSNT